MRWLVTLIFGMLSFLSLRVWAQQVDDRVPGEFIIKYKGNVTSIPSNPDKHKKSKHSKIISHLHRVHKYKAKNNIDADSVIEELKNDPDVQYIEPVYRVTLSQTVVPASSQVYSFDDVQPMLVGAYSQSGSQFGVPEAWSVMSPSNGSSSSVPIVAVIDTGLDLSHSLFINSGSLWSNSREVLNGIDDDGNGFIDDIHGWNFYAHTNNPQDDHGHGTHVSGIVQGMGQDIFANPVAAAKIRIMPLKFLNSAGSGNTSDAVAAIYYAVDNGAKVLNNSWGGGSYSQSLHEALTYAHNHGVFISTAAGNSSTNNDASPTYPANLPIPSQASVAATDDYDALALFSSYGPTTVHLGAPGVAILSTYPGNSYRYISGTSMATPMVAGLAAIVSREAVHLSGYQIRDLILSNVDHLNTLVGKTTSAGRLNAYHSVVTAQANTSVLGFTPAYSPAAPAGYQDSTQKAAGCGTVSILMNNSAGGGSPFGGQGLLGNFIFGFLLLAPLFAWLIVRYMMLLRNERRKHDRFIYNSGVQIRVGGRTLDGQLKTISEGGVSFLTDSSIAEGGQVNLEIVGPDGQEIIQVTGQIVWGNEQGVEQKFYGVKFAPLRENVIDQIRLWTSQLVKS